MDTDEENEIVNDHAATVMRRLTTDGRAVEAVITFVLFEGGEDYNIGMMIKSDPSDDEAESIRVRDGFLMVASNLLNERIHELGLCPDCNEEKGPLQ